ncbi:hypothetical protein [Ilumatobacter nonamiensis]|uniref:hypothetical protein n=1 Tax=Ilumatobacter nonamiensis TaxID=467093 RepID=UPI00034717DD|nr:hypothetical protein [Ilumatobacter nonamiensis]
MEPAPLPPHERHWRHPSELAPTALDVESGGGSRALIVATGTTALLLVAVLAIALAPSRTSAPIAVSATTLPSATIQLRSASTQVTVDAPVAVEQNVLTFRNMMRPDRGVALAGAPNAVSAAPVGDADDFALARGVPAATDRVIVLTTSFAYDLKWGDIDHITAPDASIVMTRDGQLVATFVSGELRLLVND